MPEVLCYGEPLIGFYPVVHTSTDNFSLQIGGDTSNVALAISKLGHSAGYVAKIGKDVFGDRIAGAWKEAGVNTDNVLYDPTRSTGVYFALFNDAGKHRFVYKRADAPAAFYTSTEAEKVPLKGTKIFHTSGISQGISRCAMEASFSFMRKCKERGIKVSYDVNYRPSLWDIDHFRAIAWHTIREYADYVTLNNDEADALGLKGDEEGITRNLIDQGPEIVALKLGEEGGVLSTRTESIKNKCYKIPVADTVGAGDGFTAAVLVGVLESLPIKKTLNLANAVAAMICRYAGSTAGQPHREEVESFLGENEEAISS